MLLLVRPAAQFSRYKVKIKVENLIFDDYVEGDPLYTEGLITRYNKQVWSLIFDMFKPILYIL